MSGRRPKVTAYAWDRGKPAEVRGAMVSGTSNRAFTPETDLRRIADELHDHADRLEATE